MSYIHNFWKNRPLPAILAIALLVRILAAIFAQGYGMHDDHFTAIEAPQSWVDGTDYNDWLPKSQRDGKIRLTIPTVDRLLQEGVPEQELKKLEGMKKIPFASKEELYRNMDMHWGEENTLKYKDLIEKHLDTEAVADGHSFFYVGINYCFFGAMKGMGIHNPKTKMLILRILHALFSLLTVYFGYRIVFKFAGENPARLSGILLALLWFMPFLSVRNLVEVVSAPLMAWGIWILLHLKESKKSAGLALLAGLILGLTFSLRFQVAVFIGGAGLVLLFSKQWKETVFFGIGVVLSILLVQGTVDYFIWDKPFHELMEYIRYNIAHKNEYGANHWEMYFLVIMGILIPPIGIMFFFGWFRVWRKIPLLFWPAFLFFAFHTIFPNKQERFILSIVPLVVMAGVIGWTEWKSRSGFWQKRPKFLHASWIFFWILNTLVLIVLTFTYSKRSRVEAMYYFYDKKEVKTIITEDSNNTKVVGLPGFYAGRWIMQYKYPNSEKSDSGLYCYYDRVSTYIRRIHSYEFFDCNPAETPDYILFFDDKNLENRVARAKEYFPGLQAEAVIYPGFIDRLMRRLNPANENQAVYVYKIGK